MGIYDGMILCSDIDGTLIGQKEQKWMTKPFISEKNLEAIRYFEEEGGRFVISTGRFASFVKEDLNFDAHSPLICVNGTLVYDVEKQEVLKIIPMSDSDVQRSKEFFLKHLDEMYVAHIHCMKKTYEVKNEAEYDAALQEALLENGVLKVVYVFKEENAAIMAQDQFLREQKVPFCCMERSWPVGVEIHGGTSGKDVCMQFLKEYFGAHTTAAVGDYENDLAMLKSADISYATGNALDQVKAVADVVTPPCWEDAVAWVIEDLKKRAAQ